MRWLHLDEMIDERVPDPTFGKSSVSEMNAAPMNPHPTSDFILNSLDIVESQLKVVVFGLGLRGSKNCKWYLFKWAKEFGFTIEELTYVNWTS